MRKSPGQPAGFVSEQPKIELTVLRTVLLLFAAASGAGCAQVAPSHEIPPRADYILAGVQEGDTIEVTTTDGKARTLVVTRISGQAIESDDEVIPIGHIKRLVKRSWAMPGHPCGGGEPVGCSIPEVVLVLSDDYSRQANKFNAACVTHDFCYRHGYATYGRSREQCDSNFLEDMKNECKGPAGLGVIDIKDHSACLIAATQTYEAVRTYGEQHFRTRSSTYCEYLWTPEQQ